MKRRAFLKSLAASVAGLFCANVAAKKPEKFVGTIMEDDAAQYIEGRYYRVRYTYQMLEDGRFRIDDIRTMEAKGL